MTGAAATDLVKAGAVALAVVLAVLLIRGLGPGAAGSREAYAVVAFALALAWLFAWPYVLPWYDALGWALLPLVPLAPGGAAEALAWILLARTAALGFGYLPARQADAALPRFAQERRGFGINVGFCVGWFFEALTRLLLVHIVIADLHRHRADAFAVLAHFGHQPVRHPPQCGFQKFFVGRVCLEGFLFAVRLGRRARGDNWPLINAQRKAP